MSKKLFKDKSLYTLKKLHKNASNGAIYENDHVTIVRHDGIFDEAPLFSDSNFKYKTRANDDGKKRHVRSNWILNEFGNSAWTKSNIQTLNKKEEDKIVLKPNYSSLKDFAYYGSAVELIKATVNDIIKRFPGGIYYYESNLAPKVKIGITTYYFVSNECQIDCWSDNVTNIKEGENPLRYLSYSYKDYGINKPVISISGSCLDSIIGTVTIGNTTLNIYKDAEGQNHLVTTNITSGKIIEPKPEIIKEFWDSLDDFERVLLNRFSTPLYTAVFDTPYKNETGYYYSPKSYTWPTVANSMTPDLTTIKFEYYLQSLMELAYFHDEYDSDNMWRMMTHEAIKNLDWTFESNGDNMSDFDSGRMKAMVHIEGRQFDDIKRYIDNIKSSNSISYNEQNNVPDYFLSDITENDGWESRQVMNTSATTIAYSITGVSGSTTILSKSGKTSDDINNMFLRRLALSSNYIQSMKGTKKGIEAILGMFGYSAGTDYTITEYVAKVNDGLDYDTAVCLRASFDYVNADENVNYMQGYPVAQFEFEGETENDTVIKLYPWYDHNEKYDYGFYYQCKGGWGKTNKLDIDNKELTQISSITWNNIYMETEPYLLFANNINELISFPNDKIETGLVCYVADITNIENEYTPDEKDSGMTNYSNYFILENKAFSTCLGCKGEHKCYGWYNIKKTEFNGNGNLTEYGTKVIYLETIKSNFKGNNPHTGKGNYDFGLSYLMKYKQLFKDAVDAGKCDDLDNKNDIKNFGFNVSITGDNKCFSCIGENSDNTKNNIEESLKTINIKNMTIIFKPKLPNYIEEYKKYIKTTVIPYLEQMIPSTVLVEYLFDGESSYISTMTNKLASNSESLSYSLKPIDEITQETTMWEENNNWMNN